MHWQAYAVRTLSGQANWPQDKAGRKLGRNIPCNACMLSRPTMSTLRETMSTPGVCVQCTQAIEAHLLLLIGRGQLCLCLLAAVHKLLIGCFVLVNVLRQCIGPFLLLLCLL